MKKFYCVLDTETVTFDRLVFDLGFKIVDRAGVVYESGSFVISEVMTTPEGCKMLMDDCFSKSKAPRYFSSIAARTDDFVVAPFIQVREIVNRVIENYHAVLAAYNLAFDLNALNKTSQKYLGYDFFKTMPELCDIWNVALSSICETKKFIKFITENAVLTEKGNPQTGAQAIYQFITNDLNFEEAHTAAADCEIEAAILATCIRSHKKLDNSIVGMCMHNSHWKNIVKRYNEYVQI